MALNNGHKNSSTSYVPSDVLSRDTKDFIAWYVLHKYGDVSYYAMTLSTSMTMFSVIGQAVGLSDVSGNNADLNYGGIHYDCDPDVLVWAMIA